jgi:hypothetical protein
MAAIGSGKRRPLGSERALVLDLLRLSRQVPLFPVERRIDVGCLAAARKRLAERISWAAIFVKAYALVAREMPALRRSYVAWPWPHLYEHSASVASVAVNRQDAGGDRLFWGRIVCPEKCSLVELQRQLDRYQRAPIAEVFRRQLRLSRFPALLRRLAWWIAMHVHLSRRAKRLGTFGMSSLAGMQAWNRSHPHFLTSSLSYGPLEDDGSLLVTIVCDHRVLDGITAARALECLGEALQGPLMEELAPLARRAAA